MKQFKLWAFATTLTICGTMVLTSCSDNKDNTAQPQEVAAEWVDLGLPSGLLWATRNIGADGPEGYGDYFAFGETAPKSEYHCFTYRFCTPTPDDNYETITKYNTVDSLGTVDNLTTLEPMDDVATVLLGDGARTPTADDWSELIDNTTSEWTTMNGVNGRRFTAANGNSIFLSACGGYGDPSYGLQHLGIAATYWSSQIRVDKPMGAWSLYFNADTVYLFAPYRDCGRTVRPVRAGR